MSKMRIPPPRVTERDRSSSELRALDCNLTSLCDHIQMEGFNTGAFSDILLHSLEGTSYNLHRLILSRSSFFRNMLHGPWKEASSQVVMLHVDDKNVNADAIAIALAYLYGHHPKLSDDNAFRVLAAASFLDLQDLCAICTDFIISELWTSNFLSYQVFAENQDYGIHGERVRNACWGYLCQSGAVELKEVLPKLSSQTLHALLTSDELWIPSEEKRFELALHSLLAKTVSCKGKLSESGDNKFNMGMSICSDSCKSREEFDSFSCTVDTELGNLKLKNDKEVCGTSDNYIPEQTNRDLQSRPNTYGTDSIQQLQRKAYVHSNWELRSPSNVEQSSALTGSFDTNRLGNSSSYVEMPVCIGGGLGYNGSAIEGPSEENPCYHINSNGWLGDKPEHCTSMNSCSEFLLDDWGRCVMPPLSWGGRVVGRRQVKGFAKGYFGVREEEYDAFHNIFEGGSLLFCNMPFEVLLNFRKQLEEMGFPCKAINDGLWLQMLLRHRVQEIAADTCKNCCHTSTDCACRQPFGFSHGVSTSYYVQEHDQNNAHGSMGNIYVAESAQTEGNGPFRSVRVHVRGPNDGLAGIGRGAAFVPAGGWPPTRFVYSRVPFSADNRNGQHSLANDDSDSRVNQVGDNPGDGLTALVGLTHGVSNITSSNEDNTDGRHEIDLASSLTGTSSCGPSTSAIRDQMLESSDRATGMEWETPSNSISLDMKTPLSHFPPFRFGVEFEDLYRLGDGQVKHSPEFFYAGSLWKVSVQAFNDEDPQGRRTLGLFLHRRKAEISESSRNVHMYIDSREKVRARFQLICPSKREVMVFGSSKQRGTPLPKAPKGWGWRTALLFDELPELLQNRALRVAAIVQLV